MRRAQYTHEIEGQKIAHDSYFRDWPVAFAGQSNF